MATALVASLLVLCACAHQDTRPGAVSREPARKPTIVIDRDGTAHLNNVVITRSSLLSPKARGALASRPAAGSAPIPAPQPSILERRQTLEREQQGAVDHMRQQFPVHIESGQIQSVPVWTITPQGDVAPRNLHRIILVVPGGGFKLAIPSAGLLTGIPIAGIARIKVLALLPRQGPEDRFPAANEDIARVYREVLQTYAAANVGLLGCSSGGAMAAEAIAYFATQGLPRPGALGLYCSGASAKFKEGDSTIFTNLLRSTVHVGENPTTYDYFNGFDPDDPRLSPVNDLAVLARFPATLIVTSTRDFAMSMAAYTHRRLLEAGVESEFLLYDGLGHAFMNDPDLPESASVYRLSAAFFDKHLGQ